MTTPDPRLAALIDIQEPLLANDWYMAPIWWLLALLLIGSLCGCVWYLRKRATEQRPYRDAMSQLNQLELQAQLTPAAITILLKRYLITRQPKHPALAWSGQAWQDFLQQSLAPTLSPPPLPDLLALHYQAEADPEHIRSYLEFGKFWLTHWPWQLTAKQAAKECSDA